MAVKSLYVGNLSYSVTESTLQELFAEYEPTEVRLIGNKGFDPVFILEQSGGKAFHEGEHIPTQPPWIIDIQPSLIAYP